MRMFETKRVEEVEATDEWKAWEDCYRGLQRRQGPEDSRDRQGGAEDQAWPRPQRILPGPPEVAGHLCGHAYPPAPA
jgi:hypothetical protein